MLHEHVYVYISIFIMWVYNKMTKAYLNNGNLKAFLLRRLLFRSHNWKQDGDPISNMLWAQNSKTFFRWRLIQLCVVGSEVPGIS